jgi:hypothetical protein
MTRQPTVLRIGEVVLHMSDGRRLRLTQVLYVPASPLTS